MRLPLSFILLPQTLIDNKSVSVIIIVAAIAGPLWITTEEKIPWTAVNSSLLYRSNNYSISYILKSSNASLWILCTRQSKFVYKLTQKSFKMFVLNFPSRRKLPFLLTKYKNLFCWKILFKEGKRKWNFPFQMVCKKRKRKIKLTPLEAIFPWNFFLTFLWYDVLCVFFMC